jgi:hypothetical protein
MAAHLAQLLLHDSIALLYSVRHYIQFLRVRFPENIVRLRRLWNMSGSMQGHRVSCWSVLPTNTMQRHGRLRLDGPVCCSYDCSSPDNDNDNKSAAILQLIFNNSTISDVKFQPRRQLAATLRRHVDQAAVSRWSVDRRHVSRVGPVRLADVPSRRQPLAAGAPRVGCRRDRRAEAGVPGQDGMPADGRRDDARGSPDNWKHVDADLPHRKLRVSRVDVHGRSVRGCWSTGPVLSRLSTSLDPVGHVRSIGLEHHVSAFDGHAQQQLQQPAINEHCSDHLQRQVELLCGRHAGCVWRPMSRNVQILGS